MASPVTSLMRSIYFLFFKETVVTVHSVRIIIVFLRIGSGIIPLSCGSFE
jgi:hypothetical protein